MGVSTNIYAYLGTKIGWDDSFNDAYDAVYKDIDTPTVLMDSMSGEYMIFGIRLYDSGEFEEGFENGDEMKEINPKTFSKLEKKYKEEFAAKFPDFSHYMEKPFQLIVLTHYS